MWWKKMALFESQTVEAQVSEVGFQNNLIIMALFAGLPTAELLRSYLRVREREFKIILLESESEFIGSSFLQGEGEFKMILLELFL